MINVLLVEDNPDDVVLIKEILATTAILFEFQESHSLKEARQCLKHRTPDLILLDLALPDSRGLHTLTRMQSVAPDLPIIILTGMDDSLMAQQALDTGAVAYLVKDRVDSVQLSLALLQAVHAKEPERLY